MGFTFHGVLSAVERAVREGWMELAFYQIANPNPKFSSRLASLVSFYLFQKEGRFDVFKAVTFVSCFVVHGCGASCCTDFTRSLVTRTCLAFLPTKSKKRPSLALAS